MNGHLYIMLIMISTFRRVIIQNIMLLGFGCAAAWGLVCVAVWVLLAVTRHPLTKWYDIANVILPDWLASEKLSLFLFYSTLLFSVAQGVLLIYMILNPKCAT